jgi:catechol 2,3-dioxygenase-like lactoylglutathione lyase family enzyme
MKRFHVHVSVEDLEANIRFYSQVFGVPPTVVKDDYAKWMLEDPIVNFALSRRGARPGVDHLGIQVESDAELAQIRDRMERAGIAARAEIGAQCCYAHADKHWLVDPQGLAWEAFHTLEAIPVFGVDRERDEAVDCCGG